MIEIPGYRILRPLGQGGMATVYLAVQESLGREVALKILSPALAQDAVATERFLREARIAAKLHHPHIVAIHDVGVHAGTPFMSIPYEAGGTVAQSVRAREDPRFAYRIVRDIAGALDHAHRQGVVHRDVKPENILLRADGTCVLSDFGIAHAMEAQQAGLTREGTSVGTPHYMSPEQLRGEHADGRSDLYSLGVVLYQLVTGELPYTGSDGWAIGMQHIMAPIPRLPMRLGHLQALVDGLLAKEPKARLQTGADVVRWIDTNLPSPSPAVTAAGPTVRAPITADKHAQVSIAVLPFVDLSQGKDQEYFVEGLTEEFLNLLARVPKLHVASRTATAAFRGRNAPLAEMGRELKVASVLEGSVRKAGDRVRVSVQLIDVADGYNLWSETYNRELTDVFAVQEEIAKAVIEGLKERLLPADPDSPTQQLARHLQGARERLAGEAREDAEAALAAFARVLALDPDHAEARYGTATAQRTIARMDAAAAAEQAAQQDAAQAREREAAAALAAEEARAQAAAERAAAARAAEEARAQAAAERAAAAEREREATARAAAERDAAAEREREATARAAAEARLREAAEKAAAQAQERERQAAQRAAEEARQRETAERAAEQARQRQAAALAAERQREREAELAIAQAREREAAARAEVEQRERDAAARAVEEHRQREQAAQAAELERQREAALLIAEEQRQREAAADAAEQQRLREDAARVAEEQRQLELARRAGEEQRERVLATRAAEQQRQREADEIEQAQQEIAEARRRELEAEEDALQAEAEARRLEVEARDEAERAAAIAGTPMSTLVIPTPLVRGAPPVVPAAPAKPVAWPASPPAGRRPDGTPMPVPSDRAIAIVPGLGPQGDYEGYALHPDRRQHRSLGLVFAGVVLLVVIVVAAWQLGGGREADPSSAGATLGNAAAPAPTPAMNPTASAHRRPSSVVAAVPDDVPGIPALLPLSTPLPSFPPDALERGDTGTIVARFIVETDGSVSHVRIVETTAPGVFEGTVLSTVRLWRFEPIASAQEATRTFTFAQ